MAKGGCGFSYLATVTFDLRLPEVVEIVMKTHGSLDSSVVSDIVGTLRSHSDFDEAVERLSRSAVGSRELTGSTDQGRISLACALADWSVVVMMDSLVHEDIALSPYPMVISPANGARLELDILRHSVRDLWIEPHRRSQLGCAFSAYNCCRR